LKLVVVTGASSGLGAETARQLAAMGAGLVLTARRNAELLALAAQCLHLGAPFAIPVPGDIATEATAEEILDAVDGQSGEVCLVNCAGLAEFGPTADFDRVSFENMLQVNLVCAARLTQRLLPKLLGSEPGVVVNVLSVAAVEALPMAAAYSASKAGAAQFFESLRTETRKQGLRITNINLGATDTPLWNTQEWKPNPDDMIPVAEAARWITQIVMAPPTFSVDRLDLYPVKGLL